MVRSVFGIEYKSQFESQNVCLASLPPPVNMSLEPVQVARIGETIRDDGWCVSW